jgi:hypothetical protein
MFIEAKSEGGNDLFGTRKQLMTENSVEKIHKQIRSAKRSEKKTEGLKVPGRRARDANGGQDTT